jgi:hypothetical protein
MKMYTNFNFKYVILFITTVSVCVFTWFLTSEILQRFDTSIRNQAIDQCAKISVYSKESTDEKTGEKISVQFPVLDVYQKCVSDKRIK